MVRMTTDNAGANAPVGLLAYDYSGVPDEHRAAVQAATVKIKVYAAMGSSAVAQIGMHLTEVKERLPHGRFGKWLEAEFAWTDRTARNYMSLYRFAVAESETVSAAELDGFDVSAIYRLTRGSVPTGLRNAAIDLVKDGQKVARRAIEAAAGASGPAAPRKPLATPDDEPDVPAGEDPARFAWPSLGSRPEVPAATFARRVAPKDRAKVRHLADAWSDWLADLSAELEELAEAGERSSVRAVA
jgi:hypothetical protein